ncbi:MAG TPA: hypothetical protein VH682_10950 [Gemmataceae bacterium]|jgi:hypothetical protein
MTNKHTILPPGQGPFDTLREDVDPLGFFLERLQTLLIWMDEHRSSFEALRNSNTEDAQAELHNLKDATEQAILCLQRLTELLLAGYAIDPNKRLPKGLCGEVWLRFVQALQQEHCGNRE